MQHKQIIDALNWRYAVKTFDSTKKVSEQDLNIILESGRLAPSSLGIEPWKFLVVNNPELRSKIRAAAWDQTKVTDASHLIVITQRTDTDSLSNETLERTSKAQGKTKEELAGLKGMLDGAVEGQTAAGTITSWLKFQTYIALGMMIETASLLNIDSCPMEGFDSLQVNEILDLKSKNLSVVTILALGYRGEDAYAILPKTRRTFEDVIEIID